MKKRVVFIGALLLFSFWSQQGILQEKTVEQVVEEFKSSDPETRLAAARTISRRAQEFEIAIEDLMPELIKNLKDPNQSMRWNTGNILEQWGEKAKDAAPALVDTLADEDIYVRSVASGALRNMKDHLKPALPNFTKLLNHSETDIRLKATQMLAQVDPDAHEVLPQLAKALKDEDPHVRWNILQVIKKTNDYAAIIAPDLVEALKDEDSNNRMVVSHILIALKEKNKNVFPNLIELLKYPDNSNTRTRAAKVLEEIRPHLSKEDREVLDSELKKAFLKPELPDLCSTLCSLAQNSQRWIEENFNNPETHSTETSWGFALQSLGALFMVKAAPFCKEIKDISTLIAHDLTQESDPSRCELPSSPFSKLHIFASDVLSATGIPVDSPAVYGKQFYALLLQEILKKDSLTDSQREKLKKELTTTHLHLERNIQISKEAISTPNRGSLFTSYALATSLLVHPEEKGFNILKQSPDPDNPFQIAYSAGGFIKNTVRGSAARAVPIYLALYRNEKDPEQKTTYKNYLIKALENYKKYLPSLMAQIKRDDTHLGEDSLAPYYFFSTVPYATSAIEFLFEKEELSDEEKEKLNTVKQELKTGLLSLIQKNGLFEAQGEELYPSSSGYTNPLGGLALIPLAQECSQEKNSALFGILTED